MKKLIEQKINQLQYFSHNWIVSIQSVILKISLAVLYFFVIGLTFVLMPLIGRDLLKPFKKEKNLNSFWVDASGYEYKEIKSIERQF
jgi:hypothetical protein